MLKSTGALQGVSGVEGGGKAGPIGVKFRGKAGPQARGQDRGKPCPYHETGGTSLRSSGSGSFDDESSWPNLTSIGVGKPRSCNRRGRLAERMCFGGLLSGNKALFVGALFVVLLLFSSCEASSLHKTKYSIAASWLASGMDTHGWPALGRDAAHDGAYVGVAPLLHGRIAWRRDTGGAIFSAPVLANGTLYVGSTSGYVLALDAQTGALRWQRQIGQFLNDSTPVVVGRVLYIAVNRTWLSAMDTLNGNQLWSVNVGDIIKAAPIYANGIILVNAGATTLALDARTGEARWRFHESGFGWPTTTAPTVQGQFVYVVQGTRPIVYALNLYTGHNIWSYQAGDRLIATPAVAQKTVVIATWTGSVKALDATTGALLWSYSVNTIYRSGLNEDGIAGSAAVASGLVFIGTFNGNLLALDLKSGKPRWQRPITAPVLGIPLVAGDTLYVVGNQNLYALSVVSGQARWQMPLGDVRNGMAFGLNQLYAGTVQGEIIAVD